MRIAMHARVTTYAKRTPPADPNRLAVQNIDVDVVWDAPVTALDDPAAMAQITANDTEARDWLNRYLHETEAARVLDFTVTPAHLARYLALVWQTQPWLLEVTVTIGARSATWTA